MSKEFNPSKVYSLIYRRLHWSLAIIIISLLIAGQQFNLDISDSYRIHGLKAHSSAGIIALLIALFFIIKRFILRRPTPKPELPLLTRLMARAAQLSLYSLAIIIPVSGIFCALHSSLPVYLFGVFDISSLQLSSEASFLYFRTIHVWATRLAMLLLACHAGAALYHHFVVKDDVLKSMAVADPLIVKLWSRWKLRKQRAGDSH